MIKVRYKACIPKCDKKNRGELVLRLKDKDRSADGCRFLPIYVSRIDCCGKYSIVEFSYDEDLLVDPSELLEECDFDLICKNAGDEWAVEQANKAIAEIPSDSLVFDESTGLGTHTAQDGVVETFNTVGAEGDNLIKVGSNGGAYLTCEDVGDCFVQEPPCPSSYFVGCPA